MRRMKALMQSYVYWLGIYNNIENMVKSGKSYASVVKVPPIKYNPRPKIDKQWSRVHIDYAGPIKGIYFFLIEDCFTKWPEVFKWKTPTTKTTLRMLQELLARFGLQETIVSDNSTPFTSKEFEHFCKLLSINHLKLASYHPRSNGLVERFFDVFKRAIIKASKQKMRDYKNFYPFIK